MDKKLKLEIYTPDGIILKEEVTQVNIPASQGEIGVLANHMNYISAIKPGFLKVFYNDKSSKEFIVSDGTVEVFNNSCSILTEEALEVNAIDKDIIKKRISHAYDELKKDHSPILKATINTEIDFLNLALNA